MCLLCHKVMTQRKLDTIKRHALRRHKRLLDLTIYERSKLMDEIIVNIASNDSVKLTKNQKLNFVNLIPFNESFHYFFQVSIILT